MAKWSHKPWDHSPTEKLKEAIKHYRHAAWKLEIILIRRFCFLKQEALGSEACHIFTSNQHCQNQFYITGSRSVQIPLLLNDQSVTHERDGWHNANASQYDLQTTTLATYFGRL
jgi:hypothetical protein